MHQTFFVFGKQQLPSNKSIYQQIDIFKVWYKYKYLQFLWWFGGTISINGNTSTVQMFISCLHIFWWNTKTGQTVPVGSRFVFSSHAAQNNTQQLSGLISLQTLVEFHLHSDSMSPQFYTSCTFCATALFTMDTRILHNRRHCAVTQQNTSGGS